MWLILYVLVWHVLELVFSWLYVRIRELNYDDLYRFRELKRWNYNKRVSVSYMAPNVGQWSPLNDKCEAEATKRQGLNDGRRFGTIESYQRRATRSRNKADNGSRGNIGKHIPFNRRLRAFLCDLSQLDTKWQTLNDYEQQILTVCNVTFIDGKILDSQRAIEKVMACKRKIDLKLKENQVVQEKITAKVTRIQVKFRQEQARQKLNYRN